MEQIQLTGKEIVELIAQLYGNKDFVGFVNERDLTERVKRQAYLLAKILQTHLKVLLDNQKNPADETVQVTLSKLEFYLIENCKLSRNYQFLYDRIFNF